MSYSLTDPLMLGGIAAGTAGLLLLAQAHVQSRLLRARIASGAGTIAVDPATGLFSAAATWHCIRAEANRSARLARPLEVWIGTAPDAVTLDVGGRALAFDMPAGASGIRLDRTHLCVVSCAATGASAAPPIDDVQWVRHQVPPSDEAAAAVMAFVSEATGG